MGIFIITERHDSTAVQEYLALPKNFMIFKESLIACELTPEKNTEDAIPLSQEKMKNISDHIQHEMSFYSLVNFAITHTHQNFYPIDYFFKTAHTKELLMGLMLEPTARSALGFTAEDAEYLILYSFLFFRDKAMAHAIYSILAKHSFKKDIIVIIGHKHRYLFHHLLAHKDYVNVKGNIRLLNLSGAEGDDTRTSNPFVSSAYLNSLPALNDLPAAHVTEEQISSLKKFYRKLLENRKTSHLLSQEMLNHIETYSLFLHRAQQDRAFLEMRKGLMKAKEFISHKPTLLDYEVIFDTIMRVPLCFFPSPQLNSSPSVALPVPTPLPRANICPPSIKAVAVSVAAIGIAAAIAAAQFYSD